MYNSYAYRDAYRAGMLAGWPAAMVLGVFSKKKRTQLALMERNMVSAFGRVSNDIQQLRLWVEHLNRRGEYQHNAHFSHVSATKQDLQRLTLWLNRLHDHSTNLAKAIRELSQTLYSLRISQNELLNRVSAIEDSFKSGSHEVRTKSELRSEPDDQKKEIRKKEMEQQLSKKTLRSAFEETLIRKVRPRKKEYVLQQILHAASEGLSTKEMEQVIVGEKKLCGRTAFYAYLKELRLLGRLGMGRTNLRTNLGSETSEASVVQEQP